MPSATNIKTRGSESKKWSDFSARISMTRRFIPYMQLHEFEALILTDVR